MYICILKHKKNLLHVLRCPKLHIYNETNTEIEFNVETMSSNVYKHISKKRYKYYRQILFDMNIIIIYFIYLCNYSIIYNNYLHIQNLKGLAFSLYWIYFTTIVEETSTCTEP